MNERDQFLLHLYNQLWNSITRVEQGLWQFIGIYAGIIGVHWSIGERQPTLAAYLSILGAFWGINIAINAGKWYKRNLLMIVNIEKQFLKQDDLGKIIPKRYHERHLGKLLIWLDDRAYIHILFFTTLLILSICVYWNSLWKTIIIILGLGFIGTGYHWWRAWKEIKSFIDETRKIEEE